MRKTVSILIASAALGLSAAPASATPIVMCVGPNPPYLVTWAPSGKCAPGLLKPAYALSQEESEHLKYNPTGIDSKPTWEVVGANVQIVNGAGKTSTANGAGNLVIGYDEGARAQTGSHNLVLGESQEFTRWGGIVAGSGSSATAPFASVTGGIDNRATGEFASVSGGDENTASGEWAWAGGGEVNKSAGRGTATSGGLFNTASAEVASVSGGELNVASDRSSVSGGKLNKATGEWSSVSGGEDNTASGVASSIFGGLELEASGLGEYLPAP